MIVTIPVMEGMKNSKKLNRFFTTRLEIFTFLKKLSMKQVNIQTFFNYSINNISSNMEHRTYKPSSATRLVQASKLIMFVT